jgi:hypothetical protein
VVTRPVVRGYNKLMRRLTLMLVFAAVLAGCGDVVIGPVDHSCAARPQKGTDGSGCGPARG